MSINMSIMKIIQSVLDLTLINYKNNEVIILHTYIQIN